MKIHLYARVVVSLTFILVFYIQFYIFQVCNLTLVNILLSLCFCHFSWYCCMSI